MPRLRLSGNRGFIYTLISVMLVIGIISLNLHYTSVASKKTQTNINRIQSDELASLVESVKEDFRNTLELSGGRATIFTVGHIINTNANLSTYQYQPCPAVSDFEYGDTGAPAAIAEMMMCGTIEGDGSWSMQHMNTHTLVNWSDRINAYAEEKDILLNVTVSDLYIAPYDAWHIAIIGKISIFAEDRLGWGSYSVDSTPVVASLTLYDIEEASNIALAVEDPLNVVLTERPGLATVFTPCNPSKYENINATVIDEWIASGCHLPSDDWGASFFDRLEGRTSTSTKYGNMQEDVHDALGDPDAAPTIGFVALLDLDEWWASNVSSMPIDVEKSWVDGVYFNEPQISYCHPTGSVHDDLRLDFSYIYDWYVANNATMPSAVECFITVTNDSTGDYVFDVPSGPAGLRNYLNETPFPLGVNFTFQNRGDVTCNLTVAAYNESGGNWYWLANHSLTPMDNYSVKFNESYTPTKKANVFSCHNTNLTKTHEFQDLPTHVYAEICIREEGPDPKDGWASVCCNSDTGNCPT